MVKKRIFFFPTIYTLQEQAHITAACRYCLDYVHWGARVLLASATSSTDTAWNSESVKALTQEMVEQVEIYSPGTQNAFLSRIAGATHHRLGTRTPIHSNHWSPPGMHRWFRSLIENWNPDLIWMNYAYWDTLINHQRYRNIRRKSSTPLTWFRSTTRCGCLQPNTLLLRRAISSAA